MRKLAVLALALALSACGGNVAQTVGTVQTTQAQITQTIDAACAAIQVDETTANMFGASVVPQVSVIEGYATGACVGGVALSSIVSLAVNDPTIVPWVQNLVTELDALKAKA